MVYEESIVRLNIERRLADCNRLDDSGFTPDTAVNSNLFYLNKCIEYGLDYILIDDKYRVEFN